MKILLTKLTFFIKYHMNKTTNILNYFKDVPGIHSLKELTAVGGYPNLIRKLTSENILEEVSRGYYKLTTWEPEQFGLEEIAAIVPEAVFCLVSALDFHNIGTQIPHDYHIAIPIGKRAPQRIEYSIHSYFYSEKVYKSGIETHGAIKVYNVAKTVADCFKFRNKIGLDVALEALKETLSRKKATIADIIAYAEICRVKKVMMPYLEAFSA